MSCVSPERETLRCGASLPLVPLAVKPAKAFTINASRFVYISMPLTSSSFCFYAIVGSLYADVAPSLLSPVRLNVSFTFAPPSLPGGGWCALKMAWSVNFKNFGERFISLVLKPDLHVPLPPPLPPSIWSNFREIVGWRKLRFYSFVFVFCYWVVPIGPVVEWPQPCVSFFVLCAGANGSTLGVTMCPQLAVLFLF